MYIANISRVINKDKLWTCFIDLCCNIFTKHLAWELYLLHYITVFSPYFLLTSLSYTILRLNRIVHNSHVSVRQWFTHYLIWDAYLNVFFFVRASTHVNDLNKYNYILNGPGTTFPTVWSESLQGSLSVVSDPKHLQGPVLQSILA